MTEPELLTDEAVREFIANGFIRLQPDVDEGVHREIDELLRYSFAAESWLGNNIVSRIPKMHEVLRCPRVRGALVSLAGPDYYLHPHRAVHRSTPIDDPSLLFAADANAPTMGKGSNSGSGWHQDAQSPLARARHHLPRYVIGFYFPHDTPVSMGPTRMQAGSHLYANPVEPRGVVLPEGIEAGTFFLVHFDMVHAGFPNRTQLDRYMVKFVFTRTTHPREPAWRNEDVAWRRPANCLPDDDLPEVWGYLWSWMRGAAAPQGGQWTVAENLQHLNHEDQLKRLRSTYALAAQDATQQLVDALKAAAGRQKHQRVLVRDESGQVQPRDDVRGWPRCWNERAIVMEDAAYALAATGAAAIPALTLLLADPDPWVQINAVFALGEMGPAASSCVVRIGTLLDSPHQQVVRQALDALGAIGCGLGPVLARIEALMTNANPAWQQAEVGRGWTANDQVRINAAFALLNATSTAQTPEDVASIERILTAALADRCGYVGAVAAESLVRIGTRTATESAIRYLSDRRWDETLMGVKKPF